MGDHRSLSNLLSAKGADELRQALNQAFQRLSHGFDTKLVGEREMQHAMLLGDSVARMPHYPSPHKRRKSVAPTSTGLYF